MTRLTRMLGAGLAGALTAGLLLGAGASPAQADIVVSTESLDPAALGDPSLTGPCFRDRPFESLVCPPQLRPVDRTKPLDPRTPVAVELVAYSNPGNFDLGARYVLWDLTAVWYYAYNFRDSGVTCNVNPPDALLRSGRGTVGDTTVVTLAATEDVIGTVDRSSGQPVARPARRTVSINLAGNEGKQLCVTEGIYFVADGPTGQRTVYNLLKSRELVLQIGQRPQATALPDRPSITAVEGDAKFTPGNRYTVYASVTGSLGDAKVWGRWVTVGIVPSANSGCTSAPTGSAIRYNVASSGTDLRAIPLSIPRTATAGSWVCAKQELQLTNDLDKIHISTTVYRQILPGPSSSSTPASTLTLTQALAAVATAQANLSAQLAAASRDDAALRDALLAAQNAQADLQGAIGNANAGTPAPGQVAPPPAEVAQAQAQLEQAAQQIADAGAQVPADAPPPTAGSGGGAAGAASGGGSTAGASTAGGATDGGPAGRAAAAAAAAGVDLAVSPLVAADGRGTGAAATLKMGLAASKAVNRGRFISMKAVIAPKSSAGRVRIALVRFNAKGTPIASKAIYAPVKKGVATKKWGPWSITSSQESAVWVSQMIVPSSLAPFSCQPADHW